jgi:hypothetical protein
MSNNTINLSVKCKHCGRDNVFDQPYVYHAGFSDQGFLYNDSGTLTLVWSTADPVFAELFPGETPWTKERSNRQRFEKMLPAAPSGGKWRFRNPARCMHCAKPISAPMRKTVHYLVYPGSIVTDHEYQLRLREYLSLPPASKST